jgi:predicted phage tail protein
MKRVFLYGDLKRRFCNSIEVDVSGITDLVHALEANFDGFTNHVIRRYIEGNEYAFLKKDPKKIENQEDLQSSIVSKDSDYILSSKEKEVHIIPFSSGGVVAKFFGAKLFGKIMSAIVWSAVAQVAMNILFKPPKQRTPKTISTKSMILNAKANSTSQGSPVPVGYGRLRVGAANILTYQSNKTTSGGATGIESASEIEFVDLISEGPIGGFADEKGLPVGGGGVGAGATPLITQKSEENLKGIYLNDTPVLGSHGFRNYILNERENGFPELSVGVNNPTGSVINKASYMKNYDLDLVGPSFENLQGATNAVVNSVAAAYLLPEDVINQSGLPVAHRVYNENIDIVTFALTSQQQHQNVKNADTQARTVIFSISYAFGLNSSNNNEAVGTPIQLGFEKNDNRSSFFTPGISPVKDQFFMSDAVGDGEYGLFSYYNKDDQKPPKLYNNLFNTHGVASSAFQFDISVRFSEETKRRIKNEGITFRILKHSVELDPAAKGAVGGANNVQSLKLDYVQEITAANFTYPNSAICKLLIDGKNFSSAPERTYHLFLKKVLVPSNYDPVSRTYDGAWSGSFHKDGSDTESISNLGDSHRFWTNNPAWIYFDLITNPRFGLGRNGVDYEFVNKWQLYKIAKYCDELVSTSYPIETSDGNLVDFKYENEGAAVDEKGEFTVKIDIDQYNRSVEDFGEGTSFAGKLVAFFIGDDIDVNDSSKNLEIYQRELKRVDNNNNTIILKGPSLPTKIVDDVNVSIGKCALQKNHKIVEPRFSCNVYINEKSEALDLINKLASVFRSINSYLGGKIYAIQDVPQDPIQIFNNSNVANGEFNYSTADKKRRITACVVQFVNEDKNYDVDSVYEEDAFAMQRFGFVQEEIVGFGVTSSSQARRLAKWNLIASQSENEIIKFNVSQEGAYLYPNSIIEVSDENRISKEKSGRIKSMGESYTKISGGSEIVIDKPYFELDKDITKTPSGTPVEIKIARGIGNITTEDLESSSALESDHGVDQDVMIEGFFSEQIVIFQGVLSQIQNSHGFQNIITDLILKRSIEINVLENFILCKNHGFPEGAKVSFSSDGVLPSGIKSSSVYSVINSSKNSFQLAIGGNVIKIFDKGKSDLMENGGQHYVYYSNDSANKEKTIIEMNSIAFGAAYNITGFSGDIAGDSELAYKSGGGNVFSVLNNVVDGMVPGWYSADFLGSFFVSPKSKFYVYSSKRLGWVYISPTSSKDSLIIHKESFGWMYKKQYISDNWWYIYEKKSWAFLFGGEDDYVFILGQDYYDQYNVGDIFPFGLGTTYEVVAKVSEGIWISSGGAWEDRFEYTPLTQSAAPDLSAPSSRVVAIESYEYISANDSVQKKDSVVVKLFSSDDIDYNTVSEFFIKISSKSTLVNKNWQVIFRGGRSFELIDSEHDSGFQGGDAGVLDSVTIEIDFSMLSERYFRSQLYRVLSVKEAKGNSYEVIASEYNSSKYRAADSSGLVESPILPLPPQANMSVPATPSNLRIDLTST